MAHIKFTDQAAFVAFNNDMNTALQLPKPDGSALTYGKPLAHPTDGTVACWVDEKVPPGLMAKQTPLDVPILDYSHDPLKNTKLPPGFNK